MFAATRFRAATALLLALTPLASLASGTWQTTLEGIDLDPSVPGFEAYYDTTLNITWLTDVGAIQGTSYAWLDVEHGSVTTPLATFANANTWLSGFSAGGVSGWRLPSPTEFGSMFYTTLGHTTNVLSERGPFKNFGTYGPYYGWVGTYVWTNEVSGSIITTFGMEGYGWNIALSDNPMIPWAVHSGRVVPVTSVAGRVDYLTTPYSVTCTNTSTGQVARVNRNRKPAYDCTKAGLNAKPGQAVSVTVSGTLK